ncbi:hypothetical protein, partial [Klebsiella pneumoniae]|uniref:hypothetical protein n=1 Tax=Klebsiella pneumoniae TaxID=573 RepID=UPI001C71DE06
LCFSKACCDWVWEYISHVLRGPPEAFPVKNGPHIQLRRVFKRLKADARFNHQSTARDEINRLESMSLEKFNRFNAAQARFLRIFTRQWFSVKQFQYETSFSNVTMSSF